LKYERGIWEKGEKGGKKVSPKEKAPLGRRGFQNPLGNLFSGLARPWKIPLFKTGEKCVLGTLEKKALFPENFCSKTFFWEGDLLGAPRGTPLKIFPRGRGRGNKSLFQGGGF